MKTAYQEIQNILVRYKFSSKDIKYIREQYQNKILQLYPAWGLNGEFIFQLDSLDSFFDYDGPDAGRINREKARGICSSPFYKSIEREFPYQSWKELRRLHAPRSEALAKLAEYQNELKKHINMAPWQLKDIDLDSVFEDISHTRYYLIVFSGFSSTSFTRYSELFFCYKTFIQATCTILALQEYNLEIRYIPGQP